MNQATFRAMGTEIVVVGAPSVTAAVDRFQKAEAIFSRFLPDSELTALNNSKREKVRVSEPLAACLHIAQDLRDRTGGLVDPAVGGAVVAWGYDTTFASVVDLDKAPAMSTVGRWAIEGRVVSRRPGTKLDLGGIAKGWTCDQAVAAGLAAVVSAGGDVCSSHPDTVVSIEDPWGETAIDVVLGRGGLATSATTRRRWKVGDAPANHLVDPRTARPAHSPVYSATVMASTAVAAEAGAKSVLLLGADGLAWAEQQPWIDAALVVWQDGNVYATTGWERAA